MTGGASGGQPCAGSRLGATGVMGSLLLCRGLPTPGRGWPGVGMRPGTGRLQPPVCRCGDGVRSRPWSAGPGQRRALRLTPKRQRLRGQGSRRALVVPLAGQRVALTHASRTARLGLGQRKPSPRVRGCVPERCGQRCRPGDREPWRDGAPGQPRPALGGRACRARAFSCLGQATGRAGPGGKQPLTPRESFLYVL